MLFKLMSGALLISLAFPCVVFSQASSELAQKTESRFELANDYTLVGARIQNNQREYSIVQAFCAARLAEPALSARTNYCKNKASEFNSRDADLRAQAQKLAASIRQLDTEIGQLRKQAPPRH